MCYSVSTLAVIAFLLSCARLNLCVFVCMCFLVWFSSVLFLYHSNLFEYVKIHLGYCVYLQYYHFDYIYIHSHYMQNQLIR